VSWRLDKISNTESKSSEGLKWVQVNILYVCIRYEQIKSDLFLKYVVTIELRSSGSKEVMIKLSLRFTSKGA